MRPDDDADLRDLLDRQDGAVSRRQALHHLTARMVQRRVASGRWQAAHRGVYVAHSGTTLLPDSDIHHAGRPPGTTAARSLVDAAQWASADRRAWAIVAAGFQQRLVRADQVRAVLAALSASPGS